MARDRKATAIRLIQPTPTRGFEQEDSCGQIDRQNDKREEEIDPCVDPSDVGAESPVKPPPNECFRQLMTGEEKRQCCQRSILGPLVDVTDHIDTNGSNEQPAYQVSLRRKAHNATVTAQAVSRLPGRSLRVLRSARGRPRRELSFAPSLKVRIACVTGTTQHLAGER